MVPFLGVQKSLQVHNYDGRVHAEYGNGSLMI